MIEIDLKETPNGEILDFDMIMDILYDHFKYNSIRVFGMRVGEGDVQLKGGYFENSVEVYLPYNHYDMVHIAELINVIERTYNPPL